MNIMLINASPKVKDSASGLILEELKGYLGKENIAECNFRSPVVSKNIEPEKLAKQDAIVFAFPLYVDGIPSHLLNCLAALEDFMKKQKIDVTVYAVANCGFFEGKQNRIALEIMKNWCFKAGIKWGQGVGIGAGPMLQSLKNVPPQKGPRKNISRALRQLSDHILHKSSADDIFASPNFPRFLYKLAAQSSWKHDIKANGLKTKDLFMQR